GESGGRARWRAGGAGGRTAGRVGSFWLYRTGGCRVSASSQSVCAAFEHALTAHQVVELLFELLLVEQLPAGRAIDLGAQFGDPILIGELLFGLTRDETAQHIVTEREIGCRGKRPDRHDHDG